MSIVFARLFDDAENSEKLACCIAHIFDAGAVHGRSFYRPAKYIDPLGFAKRSIVQTNAGTRHQFCDYMLMYITMLANVECGQVKTECLGLNQ